MISTSMVLILSMMVSFIRMFLLVLIGFFLQTYLSTRLIPPAPQHVVQELNVVYIRVSYVRVRSACSSKKSGSGVASKSSTVENGHFSSDGGFLLELVLNVSQYILFLADVPVNKVDSSSSTTRGARAKRQGAKIVCVYIRVSYICTCIHVYTYLLIAACSSSKKSGSGVASKSSTVENGNVSSDGGFLLEL